MYSWSHLTKMRRNPGPLSAIVELALREKSDAMDLAGVLRAQAAPPHRQAE
jgi:hypothetical protein